ncbi:MAG: M23 family metallopeptidase [Saprospiraceae bacterium]|nr:M23 family metallopeptidase [Saprospiraceae bacterium]
MIRKLNIIFTCALILLTGCSILKPKSTILPDIDKPTYLTIATQYNEYGVQLSIKNELPVERTFILNSSSLEWADQILAFNPIIIPPDSSIKLPTLPLAANVDTSSYIKSLQGKAYVGNARTVDPDTSFLYTYPFLPEKSYRVLQGYNGSFTHHETYNRYAIDFNLFVGDTICAARSGIVAYLFEESTIGGKGDQYLPYANFIMILHEDGTVAQYAHLQPYGALVEIGDNVKKGQIIGISGETGYVDGAHLHFNLIKPGKKSPISIPIQFENISGEKLKRGKKVSH